MPLAASFTGRQGIVAQYYLPQMAVDRIVPHPDRRIAQNAQA